MENPKFNLDKYRNADPWQFEEEFATMGQRDRLSLLFAMEGVAEAAESAGLLLSYAIHGEGGYGWIRFQGLEWSSVTVPVHISHRLDVKGHIKVKKE